MESRFPAPLGYTLHVSTQLTSMAPPNPSDGTSLRILVAEDDPVNQSVAQYMLQKLGHQVDVVANGRDTVETVKNRHYDVVLMDVHMPGMDGCEATQKIRSEVARDRQPRIIAVTATSSATDLERCLQAGMDGHIAKPMSRKELIEALAAARQIEADKGDEETAGGLAAEIEAMVQSIGRAGTADVMAAHLEWTRGLFDKATAMDAASLGDVAHALRSSSRLLGFHALADRCDELDLAFRSKIFVDVPKAFVELRDLLEASAPVLQAAIVRLRDDP